MKGQCESEIHESSDQEEKTCDRQMSRRDGSSREWPAGMKILKNQWCGQRTSGDSGSGTQGD